MDSASALWTEPRTPAGCINRGCGEGSGLSCKLGQSPTTADLCGGRSWGGAVPEEECGLCSLVLCSVV